MLGVGGALSYALWPRAAAPGAGGGVGPPALVVVPGLAMGPMLDGDAIVVGVNPAGEVRAMRENSTHHAIYLLDHVRSMMPRLTPRERERLSPKVEELRRMLEGLGG